MTRRPPKPRITKPNLSWRWKGERRGWQPYYRVSFMDGGRERRSEKQLPWNGDAQALDAAYWEHRAGRAPVAPEAPPQFTWGQLIALWRGSPRGEGSLSESTKRSYRRAMNRILDASKDMDVRDTTSADLYEIHEAMAAKPREADRIIETVKLLWNWAKKPPELWPLGDNPASAIEKFGKTSEFLPWPEWLVDLLDDAPAAVRIGCTLILGTGQRPSAALDMRWSDFRDGRMCLLDDKTDTRFWIPCPQDLADFVAALPASNHEYILSHEDGPMGYDRWYRQFSNWRDGLERKDEAKIYVPHGLRKLAIIELAESGATDAQIQSITNQSLATVEYYRRLADRTKLSQAAMAGRTRKLKS